MWPFLYVCLKIKCRVVELCHQECIKARANGCDLLTFVNIDVYLDSGSGLCHSRIQFGPGSLKRECQQGKYTSLGWNLSGLNALKTGIT